MALARQRGAFALAAISLVQQALWLPLAQAAQAPAAAPATLVGPPAPAEARSSVWSFGLTGFRQSLKSGDDNQVLGNSAAVQIGYGVISSSWFALVSLDILLGPYEPTFGRQLDVDFAGTGATIWTGFSAQAANLRSTEGGYGFALGISYADITGRSAGNNHQDSGKNDTADRQLVQNYVMQVNTLSLMPAVFFSWLAPARPHGNSPDQLKTRLEGYILTLGAALPITSTYSVRYTEPCQSDASCAPPLPTGDHGSLHGYSILISMTSLLGT